MEFNYLRDSQIEEIAVIISSNYKAARKMFPLLSDKYEDIEMHIENLKQNADRKNFVVATEKDKVIGFMSGFGIDDFKGTVRGALSIPSLHGVAEGYDKDHVYSELYKRVSELWANDRCYTQAVMLYANDFDVVNTWAMNGFGMLVIDAVRPLEKVALSPAPDNLAIRQAEEKDLLEMEPLFRAIGNHLSEAPVFLRYEASEDYTEEYKSWLETADNILWIAEYDHAIIGYLKTNTSEINMDELDDGYTMGINGAYVLPMFRGQNIMARLLNAAIDWAVERGLKRCSTDFETANIEGRHFWLKHFTPYCKSMIRRIDERNSLDMLHKVNEVYDEVNAIFN